jgi:hypothetical protein
METNGWEVFLWYCFGALSYMLVSRLLRYGNLIVLYNAALVSILNIIYLADKEVKFLNEYRYNILKDSDVPKEEIKILMETSDRSIEVWRFLVIQTLIGMTPPRLRASLKFKNWEQAINLIEKQNKE